MGTNYDKTMTGASARASDGSPIPLKGWIKKKVKKEVKKKVKKKVAVKPKIKVNQSKGTVTEITPTSEITRNSWPNVKPGEVSSFPGTTTLPSGKVIPFDAMKTQILKP